MSRLKQYLYNTLFDLSWILVAVMLTLIAIAVIGHVIG